MGISKDIIVIAKHIVDNEMRQSAKTTRGVCEKILVLALENRIAQLTNARAEEPRNELRGTDQTNQLSSEE